MRKNEYFKKKELNLSKVTIYTLTENGKSKLKVLIKTSLKVASLLLGLSFVVFITWSIENTKLKEQKQICDDLVSTAIWKEKEALRLNSLAKQKALNKKLGIVRTKNRDYLDYIQHTVTMKDKVLARRSITECDDLYTDGLESN